MDKSKLQKILAEMSNFDSGLGGAFKTVEEEMKKVANKLREEAQSKTFDDVKKMREQIHAALTSLMSSFDTLKSELGQNEKNLTQTLTFKLDALRTATAQLRVASSEQVKLLAEKVSSLRNDITEISQRKAPDFSKDIERLRADIEKMMQVKEVEDDGEVENLQKQLDDLTKEFIDLRKRANTAYHPGGQANRNILVAGNPSTLGRYTDLNFKPGANVTLTYVNNDTLKTTDLTIAATGGAGTSRSISTVSVSSVVAATASTDIVIIASAGILLTMPTAAGNTNLYTLKNSAASSVMVKAAGAETIDGSANIILTTQYTSVDLISDSSNWQVT